MTVSRIKRQEWIFIIGLLLLAAGLRFAGTNYGQPDPRYMPSDLAKQQLPVETPIHPDEYFFVGIPFQMAVTKYPNPKFFENPNFLIYVDFITDLVTGATNGITQEMRAGVGQRQYAPFSAYVMARVFSALGGVLAAAGAYAVARRLGGRFAAAGAGLLTAVSFTMVQHGHYATPSSIAAAFTIVCVWACLVTLQARWLNAPMFALAGIMAGLAATSRYNAAGVSIVVFLTGLALLYRYRARRTFGVVLLGWLLFPAAFVFGTPGILFDFPKFERDFTRIFTQFLTTGYGFSNNYLVDAWRSLWFHLRYLGLFSLGIPAVIAAAGGVILALRRGDGSRRLFAAMLLIVLAVYALVVLRNVRPSYNDHMLVPIIPVLALFAGIGAARIRKRLIRARIPSAASGAGVALALVAVTLVPAVQVDRIFTQTDTRYVMQHWVYDHIPRGSPVHFAGPYNVTLDPADYVTSQTFLDNFTTVDEMRQQGAEYVILSDAWLHDVLRSAEWMPPDFVAKVRNYYASFDRAAVEVARIDRPIWTGYDWFMHTASYWHDPALTLYCLTPAACAAVH